jgi:creatinine amidohydrolase/Fe(II)-dependent formamide hydrolase-like protein
MQVRETKWMQVEEYLARDTRAVIPLGSMDQHSCLARIMRSY